MKMAVFCVVALCSLVENFTDVSEVLVASIAAMRLMMLAASTSET
jgi:hypothetical protein